MNVRVGLGFDAHPLVEGRPLVLGGVDIPFEKGLSGHSDGDVVVHALLDALLGAAALGDKGAHFPSSDPDLKNVSSLFLLEKVGSMLTSNEWQVVNLDATILAQRPRLGPFIAQMRERIAATLHLEKTRVSLKVTTTDYLGFTGREEGMAAYAVALVEAKV
ncbi:MAG: 2-C-methyl-D-erythritol 2,4-cyclodiphosphate synthase [Dehalococcoidia bacterium]|nr:2-C-methyl-D-erythritol 2,4-cyclodiphosphate synthase [Chloroflexota bacterium]